MRAIASRTAGQGSVSPGFGVLAQVRRVVHRSGSQRGQVSAGRRIIEHMFEASGTEHTPPATTATGEPVDASTLTDWTTALVGVAEAAADDTARVDAMRALEELKCAAEAAQADLAVDFDTSMRTAAAKAGVPAARQGRGIAHQVALARHESPHLGKQHLGLAKVLRAEMPHTLAVFRAGRITEWTATVLVRETACLDLEHRTAVDTELAGTPAAADALEAMSPTKAAAEARKIASRLDPASVARRRAKAETERRVTIRPAPDTMTYVTGLLPVKQGVAVFAALKQATDTLIASGDDRTRGQIMADTLVERITGQATANRVPVTVNLVVSDDTLLCGGNTPGHLDGYGPIPADLARNLVTDSLDPHTNTHTDANPSADADAGWTGRGPAKQDDNGSGGGGSGHRTTGDQKAEHDEAEAAATTEVQTWLRKVYAGPHGGLIAMDSRARLVPQNLARFLRIRDAGICRTPWCDAPIRHYDHIQGVEHGGTTTQVNLQGLCQACNHAKQAPGWTATSTQPPDAPHEVVITTPTGHDYHSTAPPPPQPTRAEPTQAEPRLAERHARPPDITADIQRPDVILDYEPAA